MSKALSVLCLVVLLGGCARADNPAAVGQHNLSKGRCTDIYIENKTYHENMTLNQCNMVGGKFTPRNRQGFIWF